ncbi:MAG: CocE/NonD family hydrolase [Pseudonocardiaceae bacterium]
MNLRGTGESDGCFQWGSRLDWSDASTVVESLAAQPWSNGNVGIYGTSYEGWTQYMAMADPSPSSRPRCRSAA